MMMPFNRIKVLDLLDEDSKRDFCEALDAAESDDWETVSDCMNRIEQRYVSVHGWKLADAYRFRNMVFDTMCHYLG